MSKLEKKDNYIEATLKGAIIGGTMLVPGVSGGSMAMILGIYKRLISSVSSFFKDIRINIIFLTLFVIGAVFGMVMFAKPLLELIENHTRPMMYFFLGAVAGGVPLIYKQSKVKDINVKQLIYIILGVAIVLVFAFLPEDTFSGAQYEGIERILILFVSALLILRNTVCSV